MTSLSLKYSLQFMRRIEVPMIIFFCWEDAKALIIYPTEDNYLRLKDTAADYSCN